MKTFIKFTNARVFASVDHKHSRVYKEFIVDTDSIESITDAADGNYVAVLLLSFMVQGRYRTETEKHRVDFYITQDDYEKVKAILTNPIEAKIEVVPENITPSIPELEVRDVPTCEAEEIADELGMADVFKNRIIQALEENGGNRKCAAAGLGISERTLYRKIKEYGL